jgi:uncharacterized protein (TIGR00730 family)
MTQRFASVCVYCGSSAGHRAVFAEQARTLGRAIASRRLRLVYGGGGVGLMGELARAALDAGGEVIGVIPESLMRRELAYGGVTRLVVTSSMHERKARMVELADAFLAIPGGIGTLDELFEIWTWANLGIHSKPFGMLNVAGYFDPLLAFLDRSVEEGYLAADVRELLLLGASPDELLDQLTAAAQRRPRFSPPPDLVRS